MSGSVAIRVRFRPRTARRARSRAAAPDEHPLRHVADLPPRRATAAALAAVGRSRRRRALRRARHRQAVVTPGGRRRPGALAAATWCCPPAPRRASRWPTSCRSSTALAADPPGPGAVPVAHQGARPRPVARRAGADRRGARACATSHPSAYDGDSTAEVAPVRPRTVAVDLLQPGHDPPVAAAQPRPLGGVPAQPAVRRRRRMPLLPRHFRLQRGDGAAPAAASVRRATRPRRRDADGDLRQRDHGRARRATASELHRPAPSPRSPTTARRRAAGRWRCGSPRCAPT